MMNIYIIKINIKPLYGKDKITGLMQIGVFYNAYLFKDNGHNLLQIQ